MYQIKDLYDPELRLIRKTGNTPSVHILHQRRDQITGVEERKSIKRKKKRDMAARINLNLRNRKIAALAQTFLKNNEPVQATT